MLGEIQTFFYWKEKASQRSGWCPNLSVFNRHLDNVLNNIQKHTLNLKFNLRSKGMIYQKCFCTWRVQIVLNSHHRALINYPDSWKKTCPAPTRTPWIMWFLAVLRAIICYKGLFFFIFEISGRWLSHNLLADPFHTLMGLTITLTWVNVKQWCARCLQPPGAVLLLTHWWVLSICPGATVGPMFS